MVLGILSDGSDGKDMISLISFYAGETLFGTTKQTNPVDAGGCHGERSTGRDVQVYNSQDPTRHKVLETPIRFDYIVFFFLIVQLTLNKIEQPNKRTSSLLFVPSSSTLQNPCFGCLKQALWLPTLPSPEPRIRWINSPNQPNTTRCEPPRRAAESVCGFASAIPSTSWTATVEPGTGLSHAAG